jgi:pimeloyl-ACP methyl ester carboxylesterase
MRANGIEPSSRTRGRRGAIAIWIAFVLLAIGAGGVFSRSAFSEINDTASAEHGDFAAVGPARSFASVPGVYQWTFRLRRGPSPFDWIGLHRVTRGPTPAANPSVVVLFLPGTNMNGEVAVDDPRYSMPLYLAEHGVDFWALDYRTHFIPPATLESDLAELKGWNNELFESDIAAAVRFVMKSTGRSRVFVAGFSRGASFAYLFAARHQQAVEGLVIFDGWISPDRPVIAPLSNRDADDVGGAHLTYDKRKALMESVIANPDGPAPLPKYKTARENLDQVVYGAGGVFGGHGGLANPIGGYSDAVVLARILVGYDRYWPAVQDNENSFTPTDLTRLGASKLPIIAFSSTNIGAQWPRRVAHSASSTGSADVTVKTLEGWGHLDVICGTHAEAEVFAPTLEFLTRHRR